MRYNKIFFKILSIILIFEGISMFIPSLAAIMTNDKKTSLSFLITGTIITFLAFLLFKRINNKVMFKLKHSDFVILGTFIWLPVCIIGSLPFLFSSSGYSISEAFFESAAGWTTTGAWSLNPAEAPYSLILWKALCSWMSGLGLIFLMTIISGKFEVNGMKSAKHFYKVYILLTIAEFILLLPSKEDIKLILVNTLFSISTSGILNINGTDFIIMTTYEQIVFTMFTFISSCNFAVFLFNSFTKQKRGLIRSEIKAYILLIIIGISIVFGSLLISGAYDNPAKAALDSITQVISFSSTSGFNVADINLWPSTVKFVLIILVFIGGCTNSTSGSIKVFRFLVFYKLIKRGVYKRIHPKAIKPVMLDNVAVSAKDASETTGFLLLFSMIFIFSSIIFSLENLDLETCFSLALGSLTNNGTAFGNIVNGNYSFLSSFSKIFSGLLMICGKLEIWPVIILFSPSFWHLNRKNNKETI